MKNKLVRIVTGILVLTSLFFSTISCSHELKEKSVPQGQLSFIISRSVESEIFDEVDKLVDTIVESAKFTVLLSGENLSLKKELMLSVAEEEKDLSISFEQIPVDTTVTATVELTVDVEGTPLIIATGTSEPLVVTEGPNNLTITLKFIEDEDEPQTDKEKELDQDSEKEKEGDKDKDKDKEEDKEKEDDKDKDNDKDKDKKDDEKKSEEEEEPAEEEEEPHTAAGTIELEFDFNVKILTISRVVKSDYANTGRIEFTAVASGEDVTEDAQWTIKLKHNNQVVAHAETNVLTYDTFLDEDSYLIVASASVDGDTVFTENYTFVPKDQLYFEIPINDIVSTFVGNRQSNGSGTPNQNSLSAKMTETLIEVPGGLPAFIKFTGEYTPSEDPDSQPPHGPVGTSVNYLAYDGAANAVRDFYLDYSQVTGVTSLAANEVSQSNLYDISVKEMILPDSLQTLAADAFYSAPTNPEHIMKLVLGTNVSSISTSTIPILDSLELKDTSSSWTKTGSDGNESSVTAAAIQNELLTSLRSGEFTSFIKQ